MYMNSEKEKFLDYINRHVNEYDWNERCGMYICHHKKYTICVEKNDNNTFLILTDPDESTEYTCNAKENLVIVNIFESIEKIIKHKKEETFFRVANNTFGATFE